MPTFSAEQARHPNPLFGLVFTLDVWLPWHEKLPSAQAYIGRDFQCSVISQKLAERLEFTIEGKAVRGAVVLETRYELGPFIHRTPPLYLPFQLAHPQAGDLYVHFAISDLEQYLRVEVIKLKSANQPPFLALWPKNEPQHFCRIVPIERPETEADASE